MKFSSSSYRDPRFGLPPCVFSRTFFGFRQGRYAPGAARRVVLAILVLDAPVMRQINLSARLNHRTPQPRRRRRRLGGSASRSRCSGVDGRLVLCAGHAAKAERDCQENPPHASVLLPARRFGDDRIGDGILLLGIVVELSDGTNRVTLNLQPPVAELLARLLRQFLQ